MGGIGWLQSTDLQRHSHLPCGLSINGTVSLKTIEVGDDPSFASSSWMLSIGTTCIFTVLFNLFFSFFSKYTFRTLLPFTIFAQFDFHANQFNNWLSDDFAHLLHIKVTYQNDVFRIFLLLLHIAN